MKRILIAASALALALSAPAYAEKAEEDGAAVKATENAAEAMKTDGEDSAAKKEDSATKMEADDSETVAKEGEDKDSDTAAKDEEDKSSDTAAKESDASETKSADAGSAPEGYTPVDLDGLKPDMLQDVVVYAMSEDGEPENVGEISEVMAKDGTIERVVIDVGGFLGLGEKPVAMDAKDLKVFKETEGDEMIIHVSATEEELEEMPEYEAEAEKEEEKTDS